jgi:hypothetical protein
MLEKMILEVKEDHIYAALSGDYLFGRTIEYLKQIFDECISNGYKKILIDCRFLTSLLSMTDRYVIGCLIPMYRKKQAIKVVILGLPHMIHADKPTEKEAKAAGADVLVTSDLDEAAAWLGVEVSELLGS